MRAVFVLTTVLLVLLLGVVVGGSDNRLLTGALVVGIVPVTWAVSRVIERVTGRDLWYFTAPYPDR
jgi:hypothetical protein